MPRTWEIKNIPRYPKLRKDTSADVVIIGGGLAGVWCAHLLGKEGKRVVLLEKERVGRGATIHTTAFITQAIDTSLLELVKMFGEEKARLIWRSGATAIDLIEDTVKKEKIECEFERVPYTTYASTPEEYKELKKEHIEIKRSGFRTSLTPEPIPGFKKSYGYLELDGQAKYHPMKFLNGLLRAMEKREVKIFEHTEAVRITGKTNFSVVTKDGLRIKAPKVVVATYDPWNKPKAVRLKKGMYTSYVFELKIPRGALPEGMYADLDNPYHYVRVDRSSGRTDRVIVGGEDHRSEFGKTLSKKSFKALKDYVSETFPSLKYTLVEKWRGPILEPSDGVALIGEYAPGQFLAAGFSGNGMTYSVIAGMLISDLISGRKNPWVKVYDPARKLFSKALAYKARDYTEELIRGAGKNAFK